MRVAELEAKDEHGHMVKQPAIWPAYDEDTVIKQWRKKIDACLAGLAFSGNVYLKGTRGIS